MPTLVIEMEPRESAGCQPAWFLAPWLPRFSLHSSCPLSMAVAAWIFPCHPEQLAPLPLKFPTSMDLPISLFRDRPLTSGHSSSSSEDFGIVRHPSVPTQSVLPSHHEDTLSSLLVSLRAVLPSDLHLTLQGILLGCGLFGSLLRSD